MNSTVRSFNKSGVYTSKPAVHLEPIKTTMPVRTQRKRTSKKALQFLYQVEHNVPMPVKVQLVRKLKYPFKIMRIGDSFFIPRTAGENIENVRSRIIMAAYSYRKRAKDTDFNLSTKVSAEGLRVWRVS